MVDNPSIAEEVFPDKKELYRMQKLRCFLFMAFLASGLLSCKFLNRLQSSEPKYGILNRGHGAEFLRNLRTAGNVELCLRTSEGPILTKSEQNRIFDVFSKAFYDWNKVFYELDPVSSTAVRYSFS
jgi:hypothetical protein